MTAGFDFEKIRSEHDCVHYFETGLWDPTSDVSSKQALAGNFKTVHCIEIRDEWVQSGNKVFENEIKNGRYFLYQDDSSNMNKYVNDEKFSEKTMFFLDAHLDNSALVKYNLKQRCPLFDELEAIKHLSRKDNIILIDDLRIITTHCWGEQSYGNINFLEKIKEKILEINPDYKFSTLNGHVENDVLISYV